MSVFDIVLLALTLVSPVLHGLGVAAHPIARIVLAILPDAVGALRSAKPAPAPTEQHPEIPPPAGGAS
jgi:hypothetical protein